MNLYRVCQKTLKHVKKNELYKYIDEKMQEKSSFFSKSLVYIGSFQILCFRSAEVLDY